MKEYVYYVYTMASPSGTLYVGVTSDLVKRVYEHKHGNHDGFTKRYNCRKLVYYEEYGDIWQAIAREKQIKRWRRNKKELLIKNLNPQWRDLSKEWEQ